MKKYSQEELLELSKNAPGSVAVSVFGTFLNEEQYKSRKDDKDVFVLKDLKGKEPDPEAEQRKELAAKYKELFGKNPAKSWSIETIQSKIEAKEAEGSGQS